MKTLPLAIAALTGFGVGVLLGHGMHGLAGRTADTQARASFRSLASSADVGRRPGDLPSQDSVTIQPERAQLTGLQSFAARAARVDDIARVRRLLDEAQASGAGQIRDSMLAIGIVRFVELDPEAALAYARTLDASLARRVVPMVLGAWAVSDLDAATAGAFLIEAAPLRYEAAREILRSRTDLAPEQRRDIAQRLADPESIELLLLESSRAPSATVAGPAVAEAEGLAGRLRRQERLERIAHLIALDSPTKALELAAAIHDGRDRATYAQNVAKEWAEMDPVAASRWLAQQSFRARHELAYTVATEFARSDPMAALAWARQIDTVSATGAVAGVLTAIAQRDPGTAAELALNDRQAMQPGGALGLALAYLARSDPALAEQYLKRVPVGPARADALEMIAMQMAQQGDRLAALDWLHRQGADDSAGKAALIIAREWAMDDAGEALAYADRLDGIEQMQWVRMVVEGAFDVDPEALVKLVMSRRNEAYFHQMLPQIARSLAWWDPETLLRLVDEQADTGLRDTMLAAAMDGLVAKSPQNALRVLERVTDRRQRAAAASQLVRSWARRDPTAALAWVSSLPAGDARDMSYEALVRSLSTLEEMESVVRAIQSPEIRDTAVQNAAFALANRGRPQDARTLLFRHPLPPSDMREVESLLGPAEVRAR